MRVDTAPTLARSGYCHAPNAVGADRVPTPAAILARIRSLIT